MFGIILTFPFSELREKAFKIPSLLARTRLRQLAASMPRTAWRILQLHHEARRQRKQLHFVFHPGWLGDVIVGEPVVRSLASPSRLLVWVVSKQYAEILRHIPWLDAVLPVTCSTEWLIIKTVFPWLKVTTLYPDGSPCAWFNFSVMNPNVFGITHQNYYSHGSLLSVYSLCGIGRALDDRPKVYPDPAFPPETMLGLLGLVPSTRYAVFHCVSSESSRNWPIENFAAVVDWMLRETALHVVELGVSPILIPHPRVSQPRGALPLDQQVAIIAGAKLFVGVDSGFSHIANACEIPAVIIMGKYRQWANHMPFSGPWAKGEGCIIVRTPDALENLAPEKIIQAVKQTLDRVEENGK